MASDADKSEARRLIQEGLDHQGRGEVDEAIRCYRKSIRIEPTAEGHTYLGWAISIQGHLKHAIAHCVTAINLDPDFGNPYNDVGVYLIQLGRHDEAVDWLERAKKAARYESRHFPHINMARVHERKGRWREALDELELALRIQPGDRTCLMLKGKIIRNFN